MRDINEILRAEAHDVFDKPAIHVLETAFTKFESSSKTIAV